MRGLAYLCVLAFASFFLTLSSLPLYGIRIGASAGAAGLVTTVMLLSTVGTQTLVPALVNRFGPARVLGAGLVALGGPAPLYLIGHSFAWVLFVSALRGLGFAVITVLMPLVASRLVPQGRRGEAIGIYGLAIAVPNLAAVPVGVALTAAGHFSVVAVVAAAPLLALPLIRSITRSMRPVDAPAGPVDHPVDAVATVRRISGITAVLLVMTLSGGGVLTFLPVARPEGSLATVGLLVFGATGALARWRVGVLADRFGHRGLLAVSLLIGAAGLGLVAAGLSASSATAVLVGAAALGIGYGGAQNVTLLVAFVLAGPANVTTASAVWNAAYDAGTAIGALLVGLVAAGGVGYPWTFAGCAVLIALSLPLGVRAAHRAGR
ncbi:Predicted arabinose efflux permease, MFS family [Nakamurella panacisegetis]|uniref:Predicted arabinose efflux permease, MFS family n=1 Tax=Nakamurella panacisegetis TaxID=1090615 RepID=A0A1H0IA65_9ACTN|nr:MFS transporter [Nakamurella panacisegetis]SDO28273.1 Predicted arabinose efflux permease, MFS family [Nakamurella panacisegetis]